VSDFPPATTNPEPLKGFSKKTFQAHQQSGKDEMCAVAA
jgi:hypothetical protein